MTKDGPVNTIQFSKNNFHRSLHWRYAVAWQAVEAGKTVPAGDPALVDIHAFELAMSQAQSKADVRRVGRTWPGLGGAHLLSEPNGPNRWEVEARLLARQNDATVAAKCITTPEAIHWYELTFFNVRDRLDDHDWIAATALDPAGQSGLGRLWRTLAYEGGSLALEIVLAHARGTPLPIEGLPTYLYYWPAHEARLREVATLLIHTVQAQTPAELLGLIDDYEQAARRRRAKFDGGDVPADYLHLMRCMFNLVTTLAEEARRGEFRQPKAPRGGFRKRNGRKKPTADVADTTLAVIGST